MFKEIILAAEGNDNDNAALPFVAGLADQLKLPLAVLSVASDAQAVDARRKQLEAMLNQHALKDAKIEIIEGADPAATLVEILGRRAGALCCMATHARAPAGEAVFGSVSAEVVRAGVAPVVLFGPGFSAQSAPKTENLLVCMDSSPLSEAILPTAAAIAKGGGARICLVEMVQSHPGVRAASEPVLETANVRRQAEKLASEHGINADWEALHGNTPGDAIADFARHLPSAMIALTTHGRTGLSRLIAGSVAQRVIRSADCPVLVLRPDS